VTFVFPKKLILFASRHRRHTLDGSCALVFVCKTILVVKFGAVKKHRLVSLGFSLLSYFLLGRVGLGVLCVSMSSDLEIHHLTRGVLN
jgi:hypothetical protein